ncbi:MAG: hypothetical protein U9Q03_05715 [Patescibacteria group bacterium]|nr:hypothetical protein [Patescibacteria group bacterium]
MISWSEDLAAGVAKKAFEVLIGLSFTRLVWLTENFDRAVVPFLKGEFDKNLVGSIPLMPLKEVDEEQYMAEKEFDKPHGSP